MTQFFPILKVGYLFTYVVPLVFVLALSIGKEGYDDIKRMMQDRVIHLCLEIYGPRFLLFMFSLLFVCVLLLLM